jgi:cobyrinic acid a,c-diamide synthase
MVGALPGWCEMGQKLRMGYREVETTRASLLADRGVRLKGHEFHYSHWNAKDPLTHAFRIISQSEDSNSQTQGYTKRNLLASYLHLHFAQNDQLAKKLINTCRTWQQESKINGDKPNG